mmetsp:Transcript_133972/g.232572  ORF Transcript_133972/g.232572 Transcript_133972/m.232572 type:complete len:119 (+) Transcript_133972:1027-1383(+)
MLNWRGWKFQPIPWIPVESNGKVGDTIEHLEVYLEAAMFQTAEAQDSAVILVLSFLLLSPTTRADPWSTRTGKLHPSVVTTFGVHGDRQETLTLTLAVRAVGKGQRWHQTIQKTSLKE